MAIVWQRKDTEAIAQQLKYAELLDNSEKLQNPSLDKILTSYNMQKPDLTAFVFV